mgnify:CR=1 FL=1
MISISPGNNEVLWFSAKVIRLDLEAETHVLLADFKADHHQLLVDNSSIDSNNGIGQFHWASIKGS